MDRKNLILATVTDLVSEFLYYGRREDEDLPRGEIEDALSKGEISEKEIINKFSEELKKGIKA